jgi:hypothetical protein
LVSRSKTALQSIRLFQEYHDSVSAISQYPGGFRLVYTAIFSAVVTAAPMAATWGISYIKGAI